MEISELEYEDAKRNVTKYQEIINEYLVQEKIKCDTMRNLKEKECEQSGGHEYRYTNIKWQPQSQKRCIHCGKTIE